MKIRMQDESELLLRELDDNFFGAQDDYDASVTATFPAGESYESEEPSSDDYVPAARLVDLGASLVERGSDDDEMVVSDTDNVPEPQKESGESDEAEQLTALVEAKVHDLFHIGCKSAGMASALCTVTQRLRTSAKF